MSQFTRRVTLGLWPFISIRCVPLNQLSTLFQRFVLPMVGVGWCSESRRKHTHVKWYILFKKYPRLEELHHIRKRKSCHKINVFSLYRNDFQTQPCAQAALQT